MKNKILIIALILMLTADVLYAWNLKIQIMTIREWLVLASIEGLLQLAIHYITLHNERKS